jgi:hypothetical protein
MSAEHRPFSVERLLVISNVKILEWFTPHSTYVIPRKKKPELLGKNNVGSKEQEDHKNAAKVSSLTLFDEEHEFSKKDCLQTWDSSEMKDLCSESVTKTKGWKDSRSKKLRYEWKGAKKLSQTVLHASSWEEVFMYKECRWQVYEQKVLREMRYTLQTFTKTIVNIIITLFVSARIDRRKNMRDTFIEEIQYSSRPFVPFLCFIEKAKTKIAETWSASFSAFEQKVNGISVTKSWQKQSKGSSFYQAEHPEWHVTYKSWVKMKIHQSYNLSN